MRKKHTNFLLDFKIATIFLICEQTVEDNPAKKLLYIFNHLCAYLFAFSLIQLHSYICIYIKQKKNKNRIKTKTETSLVRRLILTSTSKTICCLVKYTTIKKEKKNSKTAKRN